MGKVLDFITGRGKLEGKISYLLIKVYNVAKAVAFFFRLKLFYLYCELVIKQNVLGLLVGLFNEFVQVPIISFFEPKNFVERYTPFYEFH